MPLITYCNYTTITMWWRQTFSACIITGGRGVPQPAASHWEVGRWGGHAYLPVACMSQEDHATAIHTPVLLVLLTLFQQGRKGMGGSENSTCLVLQNKPFTQSSLVCEHFSLLFYLTTALLWSLWDIPP